MHTVAFYSFKGGVGRTLALVNIGVELARTGRKVLLVDFDLEAPGIDTFPDLAPASPSLGVLDYITEYLTAERPPDFNDYHYEAEHVRSDEGKLWIMPAGRMDNDYGSKLASLDWQELYERHDGFLLMEYLKQQWEKTLAPDYVLIDSRTGHTEVGGICTRQLPDTVVVLFIPNEQNLEGVSTVVDAIRLENSANQSKIAIELVASNVPSLDDEYQILRKMMRKFEKQLIDREEDRRPSSIATINRYDSMHLLNQSLFIIERPQSRLAKQYRRLLHRIVGHNLEDREAALRQVSDLFPRPAQTRRVGLRAADFQSVISQDAERKIQDILEYHAKDDEINFMIGQLYKSRGDLDDALLFFSRAAELASTKNHKEAFQYQLEKLETLINQGETDGINEQLVDVLGSEITFPDVRQAFELLTRIEAAPSFDWLEYSAIASLTLDELDDIAWPCCSNREWQEFAIAIYRRIVERNPEDILGKHQVNIVLASIGSQNYDLVLNAFSEEDLEEEDIQTCFNHAMANWGKQGKPAPNLFARVLDLDDVRPPPRDVNYEQCIALASAISGNPNAARERLGRSRQLAAEFPRAEFSCWRYLRVDEQQFLEDLREIDLLIGGQAILPPFMRQTGTG